MIKKIIILIVFFSMSLFAKEVATVTALKGNATINRMNENMVAILSSKIEDKDIVYTQTDSKMQIIFLDNTTITIGQNTKFSVEKYFFDEDSTPEVKFSLLKGAMKVMTGKIGKIAPDKFKVKTKTATIGIRGTNFTLVSQVDGSLRVYCTFGAISALVGKKLYNINEGFYIDISVDGKVTIIGFNSTILENMIKNNFGDSVFNDFSLNEYNQPRIKTPIDKSEISYSGKLADDISELQKDGIESDILGSKTDPTTPDPTTPDPTTPDPATPDPATPDPATPDPATIGTPMFLGQTTFYDNTGTYEDNEPFVGFSIVNGLFKANESYILSWAKYVIQTTPDSFVSNEKFQTKFASIKNNPYIPITSAFVIDNSKNYFNAAGDDLSNSDSMYWGNWGIKYTETTSIGESKTADFDGFWVAGTMTDGSLIDSYTNENVVYTGKYRGFDNQKTEVNGAAKLNVNFFTDVVSLDIDGQQITSILEEDVISDGMSEFEISSLSGWADGTFYGATGNEVGGYFNLYTRNELTGIYQVSTSEVLSSNSVSSPIVIAETFDISGQQASLWSDNGGGTHYGPVHVKMDIGLFDSSINVIDHTSLVLDPTPVSYTSGDEFQAKFKLNTDDYSFSDANARNYFNALPDLEEDDYMSWGEWGAVYTDNTAGLIDREGFWVASEIASQSIIDSYTMTDALYSGSYMGTSDSVAISGTATMNVNFATDNIDLTLENLGSESMEIYGFDDASFGGVGDNIFTEGHFYGPTANEAGGFFSSGSYNNSPASVRGVYQVKSTQVLH